MASLDGWSGIAEVLAGRLVAPLFQPVLDLDRMTVVGFEALARGPIGPLFSPTALLAAARSAGRLVELDWLCREQAVQEARQGGLRHPLSLFVNAEPETLLASPLDAQRWAQFTDLRCYAEVTERALAARPAALLRAIDEVRALDWGVAVDDVGADPASLALLPLLQPDVIKLDMALLQDRPSGPADVTAARVLHGALAQATSTGAVVVAEGIETEQHLDLARALGAHYGQGYLLGRPAALPGALGTPPAAAPLVRRLLDRRVLPGPFAVAADLASSRRLGRPAVLEVARQLLAQAGVQQPQPVVLVCANDPSLLPPQLLGLLHGLRHLPLTGLVGSPACCELAPHLIGATLEPGDPAGEDFDVVVLSPHYAAALVARAALPDSDQYDALLTFATHIWSLPLPPPWPAASSTPDAAPPGPSECGGRSGSEPATPALSQRQSAAAAASAINGTATCAGPSCTARKRGV